MKTLVIRVDPERRAWWKQTLQELLPDLKVLLKDEDLAAYQPADVSYVVTWNPPSGWLATLPNLECVLSVGAGVGHVLKDPGYPRQVPIIRTISESLRTRMTEYVVLHVLRFHRRLPEIVDAQTRAEWIQYVEPLASDIRVGILGLGNLGGAAARALVGLGYDVAGWSRRGRPIEGVSVHVGVDGLRDVLARSRIVVCMLPQTAATLDVLDLDAFRTMPSDGALINVGRGENLVDADLIAALDSGHLRGATLDVFRDEPLPRSHPFWSHPKILITSHTASAIEPATGGQVIAENLKAFIRGDHVPDVVDIEQGY